MAEVVFWQTHCELPAKKAGFHLITDIIAAQLKQAPWVEIGLLNLFLQHTSASICLSENTCSDVPTDLQRHFSRLVPEDDTLYQHLEEGSDDMPAHIKNVILGSSLIIPITKGHLNLGRWQGIFLCEHREQARNRHLVLSLQGK